MKRVLTLTAFICISIISFAQVTIQMEKYNNVYRIPCVVNGAKMKFIFDTGASKVCISQTMAEYLYDNDMLKDEDILSIGQSSVADGRIVDHINIILRDVEIAGLHLKDVKAVVTEGLSAPLLLGQSAIQQLGPITINGDKLIINNAEVSNPFSKEEIDSIWKAAKTYYDKNFFAACLDELVKIKDYLHKDYELLTLSTVYRKNDLYTETIGICKKWLSLFDDTCTNNTMRSTAYENLAFSYRFTKNYDKAIIYYQKALAIEEEDFFRISCYNGIALAYMGLDDYHSAYYNMKIALSICEKTDDKRITDLHKGELYNQYAYTLYKLNNIKEANKYYKLAAKYNYQPAIDYCKQTGIRF